MWVLLVSVFLFYSVAVYVFSDCTIKIKTPELSYFQYAVFN